MLFDERIAYSACVGLAAPPHATHVCMPISFTPAALLLVFVFHAHVQAGSSYFARQYNGHVSL